MITAAGSCTARQVKILLRVPPAQNEVGERFVRGSKEMEQTFAQKP